MALMRSALLALLLLGCDDLTIAEAQQAGERCAEWRDAHAKGGDFTCVGAPTGGKLFCEVSGPSGMFAITCTPDGCYLNR